MAEACKIRESPQKACCILDLHLSHCVLKMLCCDLSSEIAFLTRCSADWTLLTERIDI